MPTAAEASTYRGLAAAMRHGRYLSMGTAITTAPTTNLTAGDVFIAWSGTHPLLAVVWSSANGIKYIPFTTKTFGRGTA